VLRAILVGFGTAGDVHPLIAIGRRLRERGHEVRIASHGQLAERVRAAGLEYEELLDADSVRAITEHPGISRVDVAFRVLAERAIVPLTPRLYRLVERLHEPGRTVVAAGGLAFGARIARERLGVPLVTVHPHTLYLRSVRDGSLLPRAVPPPLARALLFGVDAWVDRRLAARVNAFRAGLGLAPVRRLVDRWWSSPDAVLGLFPDWFAPPQEDWPPQTRLSGFALYDASDAEAVPDAARRFLDAGDPPVVVSTASWMRESGAFFHEALAACRRLGRRAVAITPWPEALPRPLPPGVAHFAFLPFGWLLPRACALVHHGGMGTLALGLAAGVPQVVAPINLDHPDNAARLSRLGVARVVPRRRFRAGRVARALQELLTSREVTARARVLAERIAKEDGVGTACDVIEAVARAGAARPDSASTGPKPGSRIAPRSEDP